MKRILFLSVLLFLLVGILGVSNVMAECPAGGCGQDTDVDANSESGAISVLEYAPTYNSSSKGSEFKDPVIGVPGVSPSLYNNLTLTVPPKAVTTLDFYRLFPPIYTYDGVERAEIKYEDYDGNDGDNEMRIVYMPYPDDVWARKEHKMKNPKDIPGFEVSDVLVLNGSYYPIAQVFISGAEVIDTELLQSVRRYFYDHGKVHKRITSAKFFIQRTSSGIGNQGSSQGSVIGFSQTESGGAVAGSWGKFSGDVYPSNDTGILIWIVAPYAPKGTKINVISTILQPKETGNTRGRELGIHDQYKN